MWVCRLGHLRIAMSVAHSGLNSWGILLTRCSIVSPSVLDLARSFFALCRTLWSNASLFRTSQVCQEGSKADLPLSSLLGGLQVSRIMDWELSRNWRF